METPNNLAVSLLVITYHFPYNLYKSIHIIAKSIQKQGKRHEKLLAGAVKIPSAFGVDMLLDMLMGHETDDMLPFSSQPVTKR